MVAETETIHAEVARRQQRRRGARGGPRRDHGTWRGGSFRHMVGGQSGALRVLLLSPSGRLDRGGRKLRVARTALTPARLTGDPEFGGRLIPPGPSALCNHPNQLWRVRRVVRRDLDADDDSRARLLIPAVSDRPVGAPEGVLNGVLSSCRVPLSWVSTSCSVEHETSAESWPPPSTRPTTYRQWLLWSAAMRIHCRGSCAATTSQRISATCPRRPRCCVAGPTCS